MGTQLLLLTNEDGSISVPRQFLFGNLEFEIYKIKKSQKKAVKKVRKGQEKSGFLLLKIARTPCFKICGSFYLVYSGKLTNLTYS